MRAGQTATRLNSEDVGAAVPGIILCVSELMPQPNIAENLRIESKTNPDLLLRVGQGYPSRLKLMEVFHYFTLSLHRHQPAVVPAFSIHRPGKKFIINLYFFCRRLQHAMRIQKG